ncbi:MAG TPA: PaaI family thioesterase [Candidatus Acidoferrales bacterium]|nr:PaaI family thioesterase [Candidatus Acidoferrales bacterium]
MLLSPNPENNCFACGGANPHGMHLAFEQDDAARRMRGTFRLDDRFQGGRGFIHGGVIATLLDEAMAKVNRFEKDYAVTAELTVEFLKPVRVGAELIVEAWEIERDARNRLRQGEIRDAAGVVLARGRGRFIEINPARFSAGSAAAGASAKPDAPSN